MSRQELETLVNQSKDNRSIGDSSAYLCGVFTAMSTAFLYKLISGEESGGIPCFFATSSLGLAAVFYTRTINHWKKFHDITNYIRRFY